MRFINLFVCLSLILLFNTHSPTPSPIKQNLCLRSGSFSERNLNSRNKIEINHHNIVQFFILSLSLITLLWLCYLHLCSQVKYVAFNINLNLFNRKYVLKETPSDHWWSVLTVAVVMLLFFECEKEQISLFLSAGTQIMILHLT